MPTPRPRQHALRDDPYLAPFLRDLDRRREHAAAMERRLTGGAPLEDFASGHTFFGLHRTARGWTLREWAPMATAVNLVGSFSDWSEEPGLSLCRTGEHGAWELHLPADALRHGDHYRLRVHWHGGSGDRLPAYARRVVQDPDTLIFSAQVWSPDTPYAWRHPSPDTAGQPLLVYETHVGMAQEKAAVGTYNAFRAQTLPRIRDAGYNTLQLMAVMEHPYYGSFGYQVANFFAASSRFGTPEELKALVDDAHGMGLRVVMDLIHSHAASNEVEGLSRFDGTPFQFFHEGPRGEHPAWTSRCFDYGKPQVLHFLLSNCRFWLDEYRFDGFRFDGVTSMLYHHHGLGVDFTSYDAYFGREVDDDALAYLALANKLVHAVRPAAVTIAEDVSGMPGLASAVEDGGCGFDYRLAMGIPECWFHFARDVRDEDWNLDAIWHELTNRRSDEHTISYVESHDQAIVGSKTLIFQLCDAEMYHAMRRTDSSLVIDRGIALHKLIRLATALTADAGYLTFMGNEFGHPEWIDFPREGNDWSYHYARRQWSLRDNPDLRYGQLADFDRAMLELARAADLRGSAPRRLPADTSAGLLVFERGGLFVIMNFHPTASRADLPVLTPPGSYDWVLDTDEARFGGLDRIRSAQRYVTQPRLRDKEQVHELHVYVPCRTALVLRRYRSPDPASAAPPTARRRRRSSR